MDGAYRLSWRERIGFCSGEFALNIIYQTVSFWLLFFYTNVFGLRPEVAAVMFLVVRIVDVVWDPVVGTLVDKAKPRWGKYRSWLILGGIPLAGAAMTQELAGVMARTGIASPDKMDPAVIHRRNF